jgi:hypothetical protein
MSFAGSQAPPLEDAAPALKTIERHPVVAIGLIPCRIRESSCPTAEGLIRSRNRMNFRYFSSVCWLAHKN